MKQRRLTHKEKTELFAKYETGKYTGTDLAKEYPISSTAINALLRRHGYESKSQSELQRKYEVNESFFDKIDTEEKSYVLGLLYADGCNNTPRNAVMLSLIEKDLDILKKITSLIQPKKPIRHDKNKNIYQITIQNKHISQKLISLGCDKSKTFKVEFPENNQVSDNLVRHFVRGYFDGDGWVGEHSICIVGTLNFCNSLANILKSKFDINCYIRDRHPERKNNIRMLELSRKQARTFLKWIYDDATIYLQRKYDIYRKQMKYEKSLNSVRLCSFNGCDKKHFAKGYCRNHYYEFNNGKEKRRKRYEATGK